MLGKEGKQESIPIRKFHPIRKREISELDTINVIYITHIYNIYVCMYIYMYHQHTYIQILLIEINYIMLKEVKNVIIFLALS